MSLRDHRKRVRRSFQFRPSFSIRHQADHRETQPHHAVPSAIAKFSVLRWVGFAQHNQTDHGPSVEIIRPIVVDKHPLGEIRGILALDLDVHQDLVLLAFQAGDLHQDIRPPLTQGGVPHDLL